MAWIRAKRGERVIPMIDGTDLVVTPDKPGEVSDHYALILCAEDENLETVEPEAEHPKKGKKSAHDEG